MPEPRIHSGIVQIAVVKLLNYRVYTIVPNVSWGLGLGHECDLLCLDKESRFTEVEIKISISDLKKDFEKGHNHKSRFISRLVYAFPESMLEKAIPLISSDYGIITVATIETKSGSGIYIHRAKWYRQVRHRACDKPSQSMITNFMRLGCMRIWSLKQHIYDLKNNPSALAIPTGVIIADELNS